MVKFPYDEQECDILVRPLGFPDTLIDVNVSLGLDMQHYTASNEFDVISTKAEKVVQRV